MNIQNNTAKISVTKVGIVPATHTSSKRVTFHLTRGHIVEGDTETFSDAINFIGRVMASTTSSEFKTWKFGFLQFQQVEFLGIFYAGPKRDSGQIVLLVHKPPALPKTLHLDSEDAFSPFTHSFDATLSAGKITAVSGDHPASRAPRTMTNTVTNAVNYLFHMKDIRRFWTVLTALDPTGGYHHLAHVDWKLRYDFQFVWRNGQPQIHKNASSFSAGESVLGPPPDANLQALLKQPAAPHSNEAVRKALTHTVLQGRPNRSDNAQRIFNNLPRDFFV